MDLFSTATIVQIIAAGVALGLLMAWMIRFFVVLVINAVMSFGSKLASVLVQKIRDRRAAK